MQLKLYLYASPFYGDGPNITEAWLQVCFYQVKTDLVIRTFSLKFRVLLERMQNLSTSCYNLAGQGRF